MTKHHLIELSKQPCKFINNRNALPKQGSHSISKKWYSRLCLTLFPDPSEVQVLVLCTFSQLLLPYTTSFHQHFVITCTECGSFIFWRKRHNRHATQTIHIIFPDHQQNFLTFRVNGNPAKADLPVSQLSVHCRILPGVEPFQNYQHVHFPADNVTKCCMRSKT